MNDRFTYGPVAGPAESDALAAILGDCFGVSVDAERGWMDLLGRANLRVLRDGGRLVAGLGCSPDLGQWFGGRRVPCAGIAGVGVAPTARGRGAGTALMRALVRELHALGIPLACLYPATQPLYRRAGFELAGGRHRITVPAPLLALKDRALPMREFREEDRAAAVELHRRVHRAGAGQLDRNDFLWQRMRAPGGERAAGYVVERGGAIEGYVFLVRRLGDDGHLHVRATDLCAGSPAAATRLLTFLGDHASLAKHVTWHGSPADPLLVLLAEQAYEVAVHHHWMLRVVDAAAALASRGYPAGLSAELHLELFDEVIDENRGRFVLEVSAGAGRVRRGGEGRAKLHVRGLAALYSGFLPAERLALTGLAEGDDEELRKASALFAGPAPAMSDAF